MARNNAELTAYAAELWTTGEGFGIRIAIEEGMPSLYLIEMAPATKEQDRPSLLYPDGQPEDKNNGFAELCENAPSRKFWLGHMDPAQLQGFLTVVSFANQITNPKQTHG